MRDLPNSMLQVSQVRSKTRMFIVTGGAGFIGSGIVRGLNAGGLSDILVTDNLENSRKFANLRDCEIVDYMDKRELHCALEKGKFGAEVRAILHQGACTDTMESDGRYMMENNFSYSKALLHFSLHHKIPFVYASSAAVYGESTDFVEKPEKERPINIYGYSKYLFDQYVRRVSPGAESTVVGLRYFNVYGPNEAHKGKMSSMVYQIYCQLQDTGTAELFEGTDGYDDGEQRRDFVYVGDVVNVNLFFALGPSRRGIFNVGTGLSRRFKDVANIWISLLGFGEIIYIPFPDELKGKYQSYTQADVTALRTSGYEASFTSLEKGIAQYHQVLSGSQILPNGAREG